MFPKAHGAEIITGLTVATTSGIASMWSEIFPIIAQIGVVLGCIYAALGIILMIKNWWNGHTH